MLSIHSLVSCPRLESDTSLVCHSTRPDHTLASSLRQRLRIAPPHTAPPHASCLERSLAASTKNLASHGADSRPQTHAPPMVSPQPNL